MLFDSGNILNAFNYESLSDVSFNFLSDFNNNYNFDSNKIIFCKTDFVHNLFELLKDNNFSHTLITHHSDYSIDETYYSKKPTCIKKWLCINPAIFNDTIIPLPLGVKTHKGAYLEPQYRSEWFSENVNNLRANEKSDAIFCNWNCTNKNRHGIIENLRHLNLSINENQPFEQYIQSMSKCKFVISPPGNGIDCHRTWEALYVGSMPIVLKNKIYDNWIDLPIMQVDDFCEITKHSLDDFSKKIFNFEKLSLKYWKDLLDNISL